MAVASIILQSLVQWSLHTHCIALVALFLFLIYALSVRYRQGLNKIPGPLLASVTNFYRLGRVLGGKGHLHDIRLHHKYGPVVRIGPNVISVGDPAATRDIYGFNGHYKKSDLYPVQNSLARGKQVTGIFTTTDERLNRDMKRSIANAYALSNVTHHEVLIDRTIRIFIDTLTEKFAQTKKPFPLEDWLHYFAFDVMSELTFSIRVGFIEAGEDKDKILAGIWQRFRYFGVMGQMPWLDRLWDKNSLFNLVFPAKTSPIVTFTLGLLHQRIQKFSDTNEDNQHGDFVAQFIKAKARHDDIPDWYLTSWTTSNMLAGSDSTAIYLRSVLHYLLKNKSSLDRVIKEIDSLERGIDSSKIITWEESQSLPYLDACIKEAGRLHPVNATILERVVPEPGYNIHGHYLPAGTIVGINPWVSHRDRRVFGEDADDWRPERWLTDNETRNQWEKMTLTFGSGTRSCIGKHIARLEIYKVIPELLRNLKFELVDPDQEWIVEGYWVTKQKNMPVIVLPRVN